MNSHPKVSVPFHCLEADLSGFISVVYITGETQSALWFLEASNFNILWTQYTVDSIPIKHSQGSRSLYPILYFILVKSLTVHKGFYLFQLQHLTLVDLFFLHYYCKSREKLWIRNITLVTFKQSNVCIWNGSVSKSPGCCKCCFCEFVC